MWSGSRQSCAKRRVSDNRSACGTCTVWGLQWRTSSGILLSKKYFVKIASPRWSAGHTKNLLLLVEVICEATKNQYPIILAFPCTLGPWIYPSIATSKVSVCLCLWKSRRHALLKGQCAQKSDGCVWSEAMTVTLIGSWGRCSLAFHDVVFS